MDERLKKLSNTIVNYSINVKENDRVLIQYESSKCNPLIKCLIKDIYKNKGIPFVKLIDNELETLIKESASSEVIDEMVKMKTYEVDNFDCFIRICYTENEYEDKDIYIDNDNIEFVKCPCCGHKCITYIPPTIETIKFPKNFYQFGVHEGAINISDSEITNDIRECLKWLDNFSD